MPVAEGRERPEGARGRSQRGDSEVERPVKRPVPGWIHEKYVGYASYTQCSRLGDSGVQQPICTALPWPATVTRLTDSRPILAMPFEIGLE